jgi:L-lysine exporter family protein LysE/ArgO
MNSDIFFSGLSIGLSLIVAIGPQNGFVLTQGLLRQHVLCVTGICIVCDALLTVLGVAGVGRCIAAYPLFVRVASLAAASWLLVYAMKSFLNAYRGSESLRLGAGVSSRKHAAISALGFSLLNPHAYLDGVVLLGTLSAAVERQQQVTFGAGAIAGGTIWFILLATTAHLLSPYLGRPGVWRGINVGLGVLLSWSSITVGRIAVAGLVQN